MLLNKYLYLMTIAFVMIKINKFFSLNFKDILIKKSETIQTCIKIFTTLVPTFGTISTETRAYPCRVRVLKEETEGRSRAETPRRRRRRLAGS